METDATTGVLTTVAALAIAFGVCAVVGLRGPVRVAILAVVLGAAVLGWGRMLGEAERVARDTRVVAEAISLFRTQTNTLDAACRAGIALDADPAVATQMRFAPGSGDAHVVLSVPDPAQARLVVTVDATTRSGGRRAEFEGNCADPGPVRWRVGPGSTVAPEALRLLP